MVHPEEQSQQVPTVTVLIRVLGVRAASLLTAQLGDRLTREELPAGLHPAEEPHRILVGRAEMRASAAAEAAAAGAQTLTLVPLKAPEPTAGVLDSERQTRLLETVEPVVLLVAQRPVLAEPLGPLSVPAAEEAEVAATLLPVRPLRPGATVEQAASLVAEEAEAGPRRMAPSPLAHTLGPAATVPVENVWWRSSGEPG